ncbi:MAG: DUF3168 domain-containing protein [Betaproteobacteria bacterium]|nr:DUF3168 domain-containing protein [Betaproteobacteria bacterium]
MIAADLVTTLTGVLSGRLYPSVAPAGVVAPYAVYQLVSGVPVSDLSGQSNCTNSRFQLDLFGREKLALDTLAESVKVAMNAATLFKSVCVLQQDTYEDPAAFYRVTLDFSLWH